MLSIQRQVATMASIDDLRLKILDRPQVVLNERVGTGDSSRTVYKLSHAIIMPATAVVRVGGEELSDGEDYTLDLASGKLAFTDAPEDGAAIEADYEFAAYSDSDLQSFLDKAGGSLPLAAGEALMSLISDRNRLVTWSRDDMRVDYDQLRRDIAETARRFYSQGASESPGAKITEVKWEEVT
jgi:hypothetical protein